MDYTLAWRRWGIGVAGAFSLQADRLGCVGVNLRRGILLGPGRLYGALELGITRLEWGTRQASLYHGTSSGLELGYELGRDSSLRPFVALRADLPWYKTELETLKPGLSADGERAITAIAYRREWTPLYTLWVGIAL